MKDENKVIYFIPKNEIESEALKQIENMSKLPFVFKHLAIMPDCHCGKGACVGTVIPTDGAIIPAAVGVDIGCGMKAVKTNLYAKDLNDNLEDLRIKIEELIPIGVGKENNDLTISSRIHLRNLTDRYALNLDEKHALQLGTLGSGNHFIEISLDENHQVWVVLHSGSRGLGNQIATKNINVAKKIMENYFIVLQDPDLAYLAEDSKEFDLYIYELSMAQDYASFNRTEMMLRIVLILKDIYPNFEVEQEINCHHNFTQKENHFNKNVWVTRKGAIQLQKEQLGIIPGSMGTSTFIVEGKGNKLSFESAPHGAGRSMSRTKAKQRYTDDDLKNAMSNIVYRHRSELIDEIPMAYKDINKVIEYSKDLLVVRHELKQILNIKGD